jgi:hypothetical protein
MDMQGLGLEETGRWLRRFSARISYGKVLNFRGILADFEKWVFFEGTSSLRKRPFSFSETPFSLCE